VPLQQRKAATQRLPPPASQMLWRCLQTSLWLPHSHLPCNHRPKPPASARCNRRHRRTRHTSLSQRCCCIRQPHQLGPQSCCWWRRSSKLACNWQQMFRSLLLQTSAAQVASTVAASSGWTTQQLQVTVVCRVLALLQPVSQAPRSTSAWSLKKASVRASCHVLPALQNMPAARTTIAHSAAYMDPLLSCRPRGGCAG
jgi:hypothetical protein